MDLNALDRAISARTAAVDRQRAHRAANGVGVFEPMSKPIGIEIDHDLVQANKEGRIDVTSAMLVHLCRRFPPVPEPAGGVQLNEPETGGQPEQPGSMVDVEG